MNLYQIDIPGGFAGTVEVSDGSLKVEFPGATMSGTMRRYNLHLLTPDRKNITFDLLRFPTGEWCDHKYLQLQPVQIITSELRQATKVEINKMKI